MIYVEDENTEGLVNIYELSNDHKKNNYLKLFDALEVFYRIFKKNDILHKTKIRKLAKEYFKKRTIREVYLYEVVCDKFDFYKSKKVMSKKYVASIKL